MKNLNHHNHGRRENQRSPRPEKIKYAAAKAGEKIEEAAAEVKEGAKKLYDKAAPKAKEMFAEVKEKAEDLSDKAKCKINSLKEKKDKEEDKPAEA